MTEDPLAPARCCLVGCVLSCAVWAGLLAVAGVLVAIR